MKSVTLSTQHKVFLFVFVNYVMLLNILRESFSDWSWTFRIVGKILSAIFLSHSGNLLQAIYQGVHPSRMYGMEQTWGVEERTGGLRLVQLMQLNVQNGHPLLLKGYPEVIAIKAWMAEMRDAAPSRLLCFVTLRDLSGEVGAVNHPTARYIHKTYLYLSRDCWVLWKDSLLCRTTCIIPPMSHAITHILIPPWHWHAHSNVLFLWQWLKRQLYHSVQLTQWV